jgi:hypothetical protein
MFACSMILAQTGLEPVACTVSLLSCMRPTMSKFRYAAIASSGTGGFVENAFEPMRPSSSPDQRPTSTLRLRGCFASVAAMARTAADPDALSSAPK